MWIVTAVIAASAGGLAALSWREYNGPQAVAILGVGAGLLAATWAVYSALT